MLGPRGGKQLKTFARIGAVGIELAASTVIGFLGGRWLDQKLDSAPYLALVGLLLGVIAGFRSLAQTARRLQESNDGGGPPSGRGRAAEQNGGQEDDRQEGEQEGKNGNR